MRTWTTEQDSIFREFYPNSTMDEMKSMLGNKTECAIYNRSETLNVRKSAEYLASHKAYRFNGQEEKSKVHRFQKGQVPFNKGIKGINYPGMVATQFVKGSRPANYRPVGTIRTNPEGYKDIKVADGMRQWKLLHRINWEAENGSIPKGMVLIFKDNNRENCEVENLELLTKAENMKRNTIHNYPPEIVQLVQLKAALNRQINKRTQP